MSEEKINKDRRCFLTAVTSTVGGIGALVAAYPFLASWAPSAKAEAAGSPVEVDVGQLKPGEQMTVEWRGKPVWIVRRPKDALDRLSKIEDQLRDPDSLVDQQPKYAQNRYRSIVPEYLVLIGICTHLGCVPVYYPEPGSLNEHWQGGFYCPCHGSRFDMAGRVFSGVPAPVNLAVPPHTFINDHTILIGVDYVPEKDHE